MMIKQSVVDVLMLIFERFLDEENDSAEEKVDIHSHLEELGFDNQEIKKAFDWLEDLATIQESNLHVPVNTDSVRIISEEEQQVLSDDCFGFILQLEQTGILEPGTRELVLDRIVALNQPIDLEQLKWIVLIVLHKHPGSKNAYAWMESLVFDEHVEFMQ